MNKEKALDSFMRRIEKFRDIIVKVVVFGSYARGEAKEDSDIDVLIVVKDRETEQEIIGMAVEVLLEHGEYISVRVLTEKEFELLKNTGFVRNVMKDGMVIAG
ncbi:nucleotidyltransferase domain-containing protein [Geoglobus acetivorans]|uniref:Polymerase nucleotidyl transferase domain-containing protein n=1 Tax=Geoglobus acetivorans TaxID=565033 RepID=A0A0A7GFR0_GEOAI|nr:hypothetical protein GACE_1657 [Geoglobus acetivorans]